jgi:hypothetical protein
VNRYVRNFSATVARTLVESRLFRKLGFQPLLSVFKESASGLAVERAAARYLHCKDGPIYVFPERKLRSLVPNFNILVSVRGFYIPGIGPPILLQQNRQAGRGNI